MAIIEHLPGVYRNSLFAIRCSWQLLGFWPSSGYIVISACVLSLLLITSICISHFLDNAFSRSLIFTAYRRQFVQRVHLLTVFCLLPFFRIAFRKANIWAILLSLCYRFTSTSHQGALVLLLYCMPRMKWLAP